jgi:hypothetical protein
MFYDIVSLVISLYADAASCSITLNRPCCSDIAWLISPKLRRAAERIAALARAEALEYERL